MDYKNLIVEISKKIHDIIDKEEYFNAYNKIDYIRDGFLTWSNTDKGLILYYSYGSVNSLITPYGELKLTGSCCSQKNGLESLHSKLVNIFNLEVYKEMVENEMGCYGPWYKIKSYNGIILEEPNLLNGSNLDYVECKDLYKELFGNY
tara:strand:+ start:7265 stop:7708 length:444 start_codon:yes stop_codon:yes gene_type:complete